MFFYLLVVSEITWQVPSLEKGYPIPLSPDFAEIGTLTFSKSKVHLEMARARATKI